MNRICPTARTIRAVPVIALAVVAILLAGCPSLLSQGYAAASQKYDADSLAYTNAGNSLKAAYDAGRLSEPQRAQFTADQIAVRSADNLVVADLRTWKATGSKPLTYDANAKALADAQARVIQLAKEVTP